MSKKGRRKSRPAAEPATAAPPAGPRLSRRAVVAASAVGLAALGLAVWAAIPRAPAPTPEQRAAALLTKCTAPGAKADACVQADLEQMLRTEGQVATFGVLTLVSQSPALAGFDHALAHHMGRLSYTIAGDPARALADCPGTMGSGCLHGVVEEYLKAKGANASLKGLCQGTGPGAAQVSHQCWHGVGHGLMMANNYDWAAAVKPCMAVPEFMDRVNCASGVFMQNFMGDAESHEMAAAPDTGKRAADTHTGMAGMGGMAGMEGMNHAAPASPRLRPDDLLYPCNHVEGREAQIGCWQMQPFAVLMQTGNSFEKAFWACAQSGEFAVMCDEGIGQAAGSRSRIDRRPPESDCLVSKDRTEARRCMVGAVKDLVMNAHDIAPGLKLCGGADKDFLRDCYAAVGIMHAGIEGRPQARLFNCSGVPGEYRNACARVGPQKS